jgi:predicted RNA binding protein YcfA (HicA-like mRNA interferase family)
VATLRSCNKRRKVIQALRRAGFESAAGGKHVIMHHPDGRYTTIPNSRNICLGTLKAIIRQCGLSEAEFIWLYEGA